MNRITFYDVLKGFAIWVVAFEHSFIALDPNACDSYLSNAIQLVQMPLFIAISGFFFYPSIRKHSFKENLQRKFWHLYIPSLSWGIIGACLMLVYKLINSKDIEVGYFIYLIFTGMWFLTALFFLSVIGIFLYRFVRNHFFLAWAFVYSILYFTSPLWMVNEVKFLLPFFVAGIFFSKYDWKHVPLWLFSLSSILFMITIYVYDWSFTLYTMNENSILTWTYFYKTLVRVIGGTSGIICILYVCKYIGKIRYLNSFLMYLGGVTLPIYVLHQNFIDILKFFKYETKNIAIIFIVSVIIIELSIFLYKMMKCQLFKVCLFGEVIR